MASSLQDKLATLDPARSGQIEAEADRLREEYLNQKSLMRQEDKRGGTDSSHQ